MVRSILDYRLCVSLNPSLVGEILGYVVFAAIVLLVSKCVHPPRDVVNQNTILQEPRGPSIIVIDWAVIEESPRMLLNMPFHLTEKLAFG